MNGRRIDALENMIAAKGEPRCRCLLNYQAGEPTPTLIGSCPVCGRSRTSANVLVKVQEVGIEGRQEAGPFDAAERAAMSKSQSRNLVRLARELPLPAEDALFAPLRYGYFKTYDSLTKRVMQTTREPA